MNYSSSTVYILTNVSVLLHSLKKLFYPAITELCDDYTRMVLPFFGMVSPGPWKGDHPLLLHSSVGAFPATGQKTSHYEFFDILNYFFTPDDYRRGIYS